MASLSRRAVCELVEVSKRFHGREVIAGLNLTVAQGEMVALVGPSGCGSPRS
jgi:ABC-type sugar transport system ATPase subunit